MSISEGTANRNAGGDLFRDFHAAEKRVVQIDWAGRLIDDEIITSFAWHVPTGLSGVASATALNFSAWNGGTSSALGSGSAFSKLTLSGQANFTTASSYIISGQVATDDGHLYIEAFRVWTWAGINQNG